MTVLGLFIKFWILLEASQAPAPHVWASLKAESRAHPAELLLAQSWFETRWQTGCISKVGKSLFCGPSQLKRKTLAQCSALDRDLEANYLEAREHIQRWINLCFRLGRGSNNLTCALSGIGGGVRFALESADSDPKTRPWRYSRKVQRLSKNINLTVRKIEGRLLPHDYPDSERTLSYGAD